MESTVWYRLHIVAINKKFTFLKKTKTKCWHCPEKSDWHIYNCYKVELLKFVQWNGFFYSNNALYVPTFILKIHTQMKMKNNLPIPDSVLYFSICNHRLRYLLTPWEKKNLTFITTNNRKKRFYLFWKWQIHLSRI